jgi:hypothetical protein
MEDGRSSACTSTRASSGKYLIGMENSFSLMKTA